MSTSRFVWIATISLLGLTGCPDGDPDSEGGRQNSCDPGLQDERGFTGASDDDCDPAGGGGSATPAVLRGSWYSGRGGTSAPYNPSTGAWGTPSGSGLVYIFEPNGTYTKAFQSYESVGACTTGFTAFERGDLYADGSYLITSPITGRLVYVATCSPELDSDDPITDLSDEDFTWELVPDELDPDSTVLYLQRSDGAEATFRRL